MRDRRGKRAVSTSTDSVVALIRDRDMTHKLFSEIAPRYSDRPGGYTRILKLGTPAG